MDSIPNEIKATGPALAIMRAALAKLNECRKACPGVGGDIDAANLRWLIEHEVVVFSTTEQAAKTLESITISSVAGMPIDAKSEIDALRELPLLMAAGSMRAALAKIAKMGPDKQPERESYHDTETAFNNGEDCGAWDAAEVARGVLKQVSGGAMFIVEPRVVIVCEGGLVQHVLTDSPIGDVMVLDYDVGGAAPEDIRQIPQGDGTDEPGVFHVSSAVVNPGRVSELFTLDSTEEGQS